MPYSYRLNGTRRFRHPSESEENKKGFWWGFKKGFTKTWEYGNPVRRAIFNTEEKYYDIQASPLTWTTNTDTTGGYADSSTSPSQCWLTGIPQGDNGNERIGNSLRATALGIRFAITANPSATSTTIRLILFIDREQQGGTFTYLSSANNSAILQALPAGSPTAAGMISAVNSPLDVGQFGRFDILMDRVITLEGGGSIDYNMHKNYYKKLHQHVMFDESNTTPPTNVNARNGHIHLAAFYYTGSGSASNAPSVSWYSRFRYVDD